MRKSAEHTQQTRQAILAAGLSSFAENGWDSTTFVGVAARAGVTRGAVHHHFSDKVALLTAVLEEGWSSAVAPILTPLKDAEAPGDARLVQFISEYIARLSGDETFRALAVVSTLVAPQAVPIRAGTAAKEEGMSAWQTALRGALSTARLRAGVTADTAVRALLTVIHGLTLAAATQPETLPHTPDAIEALATACVRGSLA